MFRHRFKLLIFCVFLGAAAPVSAQELCVQWALCLTTGPEYSQQFIVRETAVVTSCNAADTIVDLCATLGMEGQSSGCECTPLY